MDSDKKLEMIENVLLDEPMDTIGDPVFYGPQLSSFTESGRRMCSEMFNRGELSNRLDDCTVVVKIEQHKAQVSVMRDGIVVTVFKPVHPDLSTTTFEFPGVSIPLTMDW